MPKFSSVVFLRGVFPCSPIRNQKLSICPTWVGRGVISFRLVGRRIGHISFWGVVRAGRYLSARWGAVGIHVLVGALPGMVHSCVPFGLGS